MVKYQHIQAFISSAAEYSKYPNETVASTVQRNLGAISVSLDLHIFNPGCSILTAFYVSLHELMSTLGSNSNLMWSAVDVLQTASKNSLARHALIHTYKFAPILTRLLEANLTSEKRIRALKLLQELTYGIKITWQEAHLPYLIRTLSQWVTQPNEEEVITLSLGVLVNLCYKNLPAMYTLMRSVNTKTFLQSVVRTQGQNVNIRVQCCKLLIILEQSNSADILDSYVLDVAAVTFTNIIPSLKSEDIILLRHIVDFFDDIRQNERFRSVLLTYPNYQNDVILILQTLKDISNQECASLIMEFLSSLMKLKVTELVKLYPLIVKTATSWVPIDCVSSKALALIRTVIVDSRRTKNNTLVLEELDLSVLTLLIKEDYSEESHDKEKHLTELMQLFQELIKTPSIRTKVLEVFSVSKIRILMGSILECNNDSGLMEKPINLFQDSTTDFYIHTLSLIADLASNNTNWLTLYTELLQKKQMQIIMASALFTGNTGVKQKVLQMTNTVGFPQECISAVARCMTDLEPLVLVQENSNVTKSLENTVNTHPYDLPLFSVAQEGRLDAFISKFENAFHTNEWSAVTTAAVMELYEYKMAAMRHAERTMQASLDAATTHSTSLHHRLAQLTAQSSQLHQVLFNTQQCLEGVQGEKLALMKKLQQTEEQTTKTHSTQVQEISVLKKILTEKENILHAKEIEVKEIPKLLNKIKVLENDINLLSQKNQDQSKLIQKIQESIVRKEQIIEEKSREIVSNEKDIAALNQEIKQQSQQCHSYQMIIAQKEEEVQKLTTDLHNLSRMRDMIFELTAKKNENI